MKKILHECGRLQNGQLASVNRFLLSSLSTEGRFKKEKPSGDESEGEKEDLQDEMERKAGVANWTEDSSTAEESSDENSEKKLSRKNSRWLQSALVASAGRADVVVFALVQKIVVLERDDSADGSYEVIAQFSIADGFLSHSVYIRSMCILPLAVTRKTETRDYDFVAIAVGLSNGYVRFYTEHGVLLRSEHFTHRPIDSVRFGRSVLPGEQEFVVLSSGRMTIVDGLSLYVALKTAKIQVARGEKDLTKIAATALLNVEKIRLTKVLNVSDFAVLGPYEQPYVETYAAASVSAAGVKACVDSLAPPMFTTYMFTGQSPFVAFGWNRVGIAPPNLLTDAIYNYGSELVSNVVSSLPSFGFRSFFGSKSDKPPPTQRNQTTENRANASRVSTKLEIRSIVDDTGREGERLFPAPSGYPFVAVTDSFARVLLIDTEARQIRRIWKGYRDARCAWMESASSTVAKGGSFSEEPLHRKKTLYLVLFAPRRGLLEVWSPLNGKRVAALNVERRGRLLSCMRARDSTVGNLALVADTYAAAYFLSPDGKFYKIDVPFHVALMHESTATIHDENVLKEMRQMSGDFGDVQLQVFIGFLRTLKTAAALREALEMAMKNRSIKAEHFLKIFESLLQYMEPNMRLRCSTDGLALHKYISVIAHLLKIYAYLYNYRVKLERHISKTDAGTETQFEGTTWNRFHLGKNQLETCLKQISECGDSKEEGKETNIDDFHFNDFVMHFDMSKATSLRRSSSDDPALQCSDLCLSKATPIFGYFIFSPVLEGKCALDDFKARVLQQISLSQLEILEVFCSFWLSPLANASTSVLPRVLNVCEELSTLAEKSPEWFSLIEDRLHSCKEVSSAFSLCLVTRAIALSEIDKTSTEENRERSESSASSESPLNLSDDWEEVELLLERWDVLLKNLQCIAVLKSLPQSPKMALQDFADAGRSFYREKLGAWASSYKPNVDHFAEIFNDGEPDTKMPRRKEESWIGTILKLRSLFPFSMQFDFIFCDCAWECVNAWKRDPEKNINELKYGLKYISYLKDFKRLQHSICLLLWETHLKEPFKGLYDWLNKAGKMPKERLARKHVGLGESHLKEFVVCCAEILRILRKTAETVEECLSLDVKYEDFVDAFFDFHKGARKMRREALVTILLRQEAANYDLAVHHFDLATVVELQLLLSVHLQPLQLFDDEMAQKALFISLNKKRPVPIGDVVATVRKRRQEFVEKCAGLIAEKPKEFDHLCEGIDDLLHDWALDMDGITLKEMESLLIVGDQEEALKRMYRVRFPELVVQHCYPYLNARMRAYIKEYCPDLIEIARKRGQWARWTQRALKTPSGENIKLARAPTAKEMIEFIEVLQNFASRMSASTEDLVIQSQVINDMASVLKFAPKVDE